MGGNLQRSTMVSVPLSVPCSTTQSAWKRKATKMQSRTSMAMFAVSTARRSWQQHDTDMSFNSHHACHRQGGINEPRFFSFTWRPMQVDAECWFCFPQHVTEL